MKPTPLLDPSAPVLTLAISVFGDPTKAGRWLSKPKHQLGGKTPLELIDTEAGAKAVEEMLHQIEHGIFV